MINAADFIKWLEVFNVDYGPGAGTGSVDPGTINEIAYYAATGDTVSGLATGNNGVLVTSATGVPSISSTLPTTVQTNITRLGTIAQNLSLTNNGTGNRWLLLNSDGGGAFAMQAGIGTAAGGGAFQCYGHTNATRPGWAAAAISSGSGGKFAVLSGGPGGTEQFTVDETGNVIANGSLTAASASFTAALPVTSGGTGLSSTTANQLLYSSATSTIAGLATANNGILSTNGSGVPAINNVVDLVGQFNIDNLRVDGNTLSSTDTNGSINLTPNGLGGVTNGYMTLKSVTGAGELGTFSVGEQLRFTILTGGSSVSRPILLRVKFIGGAITSANKSAFFDGIISVVMNGSGTSFFVNNINTLAQNRFVQSDIELRTVGTTSFDIIIRQPESTGNYLAWSCSVESLNAQSNSGILGAAAVLESADAYTTPVNCVTPVIARGTGYVDLVANDNSIVQISSSGLTIQGAYTLTAGGTITSTSGINFGQDTLDYYDEGTFTPVLAFGGASVGITYSIQTGKYTRTGNVVTITMIIALSSKGSSTGNATITGLPIAANPTGSQTSTCYAANLTASVPSVLISPGTTLLVRSVNSGAAATDLTNAEFVNSTVIAINMSYFTT